MGKVVEGWRGRRERVEREWEGPVPTEKSRVTGGDRGWERE